MKLRSTIFSFFVLVALLFTSTAFAQEVNVYRLYNRATGEHLYTTDQNEVTVLSKQHGWTDEGVGWKAPDSGESVFRLYNDGLKDHLYTNDTNEINTLVSGMNWTQDFNSQPLFYSGGSIPIYRLYNEQTGRHHLTTDENEYNTLPSQGWKQEGAPLAAVGYGEPKPAGPQVIVNLKEDTSYIIGGPFDINEVINKPFTLQRVLPAGTTESGFTESYEIGTYYPDANHQIVLESPEEGQYSLYYMPPGQLAGGGYTGNFTIPRGVAENGGSVDAYIVRN